MDITIDTSSALPVYEQIKQQIKLLIISGVLTEDDKMPSIRELSKQLRVNANTIVKVYYQLDMETYLYSAPGKGYFVANCQKQPDKERFRLFRQLTKNYVDNAVKLGFGVDDMVKEISTLVE